MIPVHTAQKRPKAIRDQILAGCITSPMRFLAAFVVGFLLLTASGSSETPLTFCDLLRNPDQYNGKEVTVRVTWRYGFEWSQLYCLDCSDKGRAWLDTSYDLDNASIKALRRTPKGAGIVNLTVEGVFMSGGHFGHLNGYPYQLVAHKVSHVAIVLRGMKGPAEEKEAETRWACGGTNPK